MDQIQKLKGEDVSFDIYHTKKLDVKFCYQLLCILPEKAGLVAIPPPIVHVFPSNMIKTEKGISGGILMIESHCYLHWWPDYSYTHLIISSCKPIKIEKVVEYLYEGFGTNNIVWISQAWQQGKNNV